MARTTSSSGQAADTADPDTDQAPAATANAQPEPAQPAPDQAQTTGTGQEPDARGVHIPGAAPGQFTDHGPVSISTDAPRST